MIIDIILFFFGYLRYDTDIAFEIGVMMRQYETYRCNVCGNEVEIQKVGGGTLVCCGEEMEMTTENLTAVNLMKAFGGESMARNKYELFADIARDEGWHAVERHFREAAFNSPIFPRLSLEAWQAAGRPRAEDLLRRHTVELMASHAAPADHDELLERGEAWIARSKR